MRVLLLLLGCLLISSTVQAQPIGTCNTGQAEAVLDANDVQAGLYNTGLFFFGEDGPRYVVPQADSINAFFSASLWVGGRAPDRTIRFAGSVYSRLAYWPGPLDANGNPPDDCADYDRMYSVYDADIRAYEADGTLTPDLRDWPYHLGAPVVDGDGIAGNYDLAAGDRPRVYGEQSIWWVMNDAGNRKMWAETAPIGLEVQVQAFAATCAPVDRQRLEPVDSILSRATYYAFTIIHKGMTPLHEAFVGWRADIDLGNGRDDYVGTDTTLGMGYSYNGDDFDEGARGYGHAPPAIGNLLVQPLERSGHATLSLPFTRTLDLSREPPVYADIIHQSHFAYASLVGRWWDGPLTEGGDGTYGTKPVPYMLPGDPVTGRYWSEENLWGDGRAAAPGERRMMMSSGPTDLYPGDTLRFVLAIPWARADSRLNSVIALRSHARVVRDLTDTVMTYDPYSCVAPAAKYNNEPEGLGYYILRQNYPEPFSQQTTIRYEVIDTVPVQLNVYDLLGRRVRTLVDGVQDAGVYDVVFEAGDLPTGTYFYRLEAAGYVSITRRMVLHR